MKEYPKIQTVFLRDPATKYKTLLMSQFSLPEFGYLGLNEWLWTEKIDGTNIRVDWNGSSVAFAGRTDKAQTPPFLLSKLIEKFPSELFMTEYPELPMTLYGEGYGARIQKDGGNYIKDGVDFILFDILINDNWLERKDVEDIAAHLNVGTVPVVGQGSLYKAVTFAHEGFKSVVGTQTAEGLVMRPIIELHNRRGQRIITKIKHRDFGGQ